MLAGQKQEVIGVAKPTGKNYLARQPDLEIIQVRGYSLATHLPYWSNCARHQEKMMSNATPADLQNNGNIKEWNVMVYMSSDNDLGSECAWALTEMQNSNLNEQIAVIAQFDPPGRGIGTKRYDFTGGIPSQKLRAQAVVETIGAIQQDGFIANFDSHLEDFEIENLADAIEERTVFIELTKKKRAAPVEEDFANEKVLAEFVEKGIERYPAKHYLVILSGYGNGPLGGLLTEGNPVSSMSLADLKRALEKVRKDHLRFLTQDPKGEIDILGLDSCLMGMAEVVSELTGTVRYLVASEGLAPATGWPYRRILETLSENSTDQPEEVASKIVDSYIRYYSDYIIAGIAVDQSVCDLSKANQLESAVKALVKTLTKTENGRFRLNKQVIDDLVLAHWKAQTYRFDQHVDLWDFCDCLAECTANNTLKKACEKVQDAVKSCVVKTENIGAAFQYSQGLSVFFPWSFSDLSTIRDYNDLAFARRTDWGKFLEAYVKETQRDLQGGFKKTQRERIFPQDGYFESRDNPKIDDVKDNPKIDDVKDNPKIDDVKDNPKIDDVKDNPKIDDVKDLMGGAMNGLLVLSPKVKNPPIHFYKPVRKVISTLNPKKLKTGTKMS